ncbi:ferredoxin, partial [Mycolicibacterium sp.]
MRVRVDRDRCEGNAFCVKIAPEVFQLDDDEYAVVIADPVP